MSTSPYYFVPFAEQMNGVPDVFTPEHPEAVSQDHPFKDGISGHCEIELEATTPIYVRNAGDHREYRESPDFLTDLRDLLARFPAGRSIPPLEWNRNSALRDFVSFCQSGSTPVIPGTSLKGPIRTVLQILTKGRSEPVNNRRYSFRDLDSRDYKSWFKGDVHAGWVEWNNSESRYGLIPCRHARIDQTDLEAYAKRKKKAILLGTRQSAEQKYQSWLRAELPCRFEAYIRDHVASTSPMEGAAKKEVIPVFVGQIAEREGNKSAKKREYVFFEPDPARAVWISDEIWQGFLDSHEDTNRRPTDSWKYWRDQMQSNPSLRMPVFYLAHEAGQDSAVGRSRCLIESPNARLHSFGLSRLYRLPYRLTMHGALPAGHRPPVDPEKPPVSGSDPYPDFQPDFPSLLLGETRTHRHLKGRVSFGPLVRRKSEGPAPLVITVLGGPKPGFYPNYMKDGRTLMQEDAAFRGWKVYAARADGSSPAHGAIAEKGDGELSLKVATAFEPLARGTVFRGKVRFHNLRPHELGALLWALTWGGRAECRHRIGMAKPLGYGCARISIRGGTIISNEAVSALSPAESRPLGGEEVKSLSTMFETWLSNQSGMEGWLQSRTVQSLVHLVREDHGVPERQLAYPALEQFKNAKQVGDNLCDWLSLVDPDKPFNFWPEWMLPPKKVELGAMDFPGDHRKAQAKCDTSALIAGELYLCEVISNKSIDRTRVRVVGGDDSTEGVLKLQGQIRSLFDRLSSGRQVAVVFREGGPRNRVYCPVEV